MRRKVFLVLALSALLVLIAGGLIYSLTLLLPQIPALADMNMPPIGFVLLAVFISVVGIAGVIANIGQIDDWVQRRFFPKKEPVATSSSPAPVPPPAMPEKPPPDLSDRSGLGATIRHLTIVPIRGRSSDATEIRKRLKHQPVAIVGMGGSGKSRLAVEIRDRYGADKTIWHTVSDVSSAEEVLSLLRDHFGLENTAARKDILDCLKANPRLIVLDNCEAVPTNDARRQPHVELIADLYNAGAAVLLTSRVEWNDIQGAVSHDLEKLKPDAARQIVLDMAKAHGLRRDITPAADQIAEKAQQHPGLIEWAVIQIDNLTLDGVLADLEAFSSDDAQEALYKFIRRTLEQMSRVEGETPAAVLKRLTVCRGGFTEQAAIAIAGIEDANTLRNHLVTLQRWKMVSFYTPDGQERYDIDPLVIATAGTDATAHRIHYAYYLALAQEHDDKQDYAGLDPESANLEAAFEWAIATGDGEDALWLANACGSFLGNRGRFDQKLDWSQRVVTALEHHPDDLLRANALNSLGIDYQEHPLGNRHDHLKRAVAAFEAALVYRTPQVAPLAYAMTQNNLGTAYADLSQMADREANLKRALAAYEAALVYYTAQAAPLAYATTQNNLGSAYRDLAQIEDREGNLKRAVAAYEAALVYYTPQAAPLDYAMTQNNLGAAYYDLAQMADREANLKRAVAAFEAALVYYTAQAAPLAYATTQNNLGNAYADLAQMADREANLKRAVAAYEAALVYYTAQAAPLDYAMTQRNLGITYEDMGNLPAALACWREAVHYYTQMGHTRQAEQVQGWIDAAEKQ